MRNILLGFTALTLSMTPALAQDAAPVAAKPAAIEADR